MSDNRLILGNYNNVPNMLLLFDSQDTLVKVAINEYFSGILKNYKQKLIENFCKKIEFIKITGKGSDFSSIFDLFYEILDNDKFELQEIEPNSIETIGFVQIPE